MNVVIIMCVWHHILRMRRVTTDVLQKKGPQTPVVSDSPAVALCGIVDLGKMTGTKVLFTCFISTAAILSLVSHWPCSIAWRNVAWIFTYFPFRFVAGEHSQNRG